MLPPPPHHIYRQALFLVCNLVQGCRDCVVHLFFLSAKLRDYPFSPMSCRFFLLHRCRAKLVFVPAPAGGVDPFSIVCTEGRGAGVSSSLIPNLERRVLFLFFSMQVSIGCCTFLSFSSLFPIIVVVCSIPSLKYPTKKNRGTCFSPIIPLIPRNEGIICLFPSPPPGQEEDESLHFVLQKQDGAPFSESNCRLPPETMPFLSFLRKKESEH